MRKEVFRVENRHVFLKKRGVFPLEKDEFRVEKDHRASKKSGVFHWKRWFSSGNLQILGYDFPLATGVEFDDYKNILSNTENFGILSNQRKPTEVLKLNSDTANEGILENVVAPMTTFAFSKKGYPPLKNHHFGVLGEIFACRKFFTFSAFLSQVKNMRIIFLCYLLVINSIYTFLMMLKAEKREFYPLSSSLKNDKCGHWGDHICRKV